MKFWKFCSSVIDVRLKQMKERVSESEFTEFQDFRIYELIWCQDFYPDALKQTLP